MRALMAAILLTLAAIAAVPAATNLIGRRLAPPAQDQIFGKDRPVDKLSLGRPSWERAGGLMVGDLPLINGNDYAVRNLITPCDFVDASGHPFGTRGTAIGRFSEPGETRIGGVHVSRFA